MATVLNPAAGTIAITGGATYIGKSFDIVIDHTKVPTDLYDFPVLVNLDATSGIDGLDTQGVFDELAEIDNTKLTAVYKNPADNLLPEYATEVMSLNPVAYWRLGEASGTVAVDEVGVYDGTYVGSPTLGTTGLLVNDADTAVAFNSDSQRVSLSPIHFEKTDPFSVSAIIKINSVTTDDVIFSSIVDNVTYGFEVFVNSGDIEIYFIGNGAAFPADTISLITNSITILDGVQYNIAVSYDGSNSYTGFNIYVNNVLQTFSSNNASTITGSTLGTSNSAIGNRTGGQSLFGTIDEVAIFNTALTQAQVTRLYNKSIDIAVTDDTISTQLAKVEIDRWDQANKQAQLWVKVPYISKDVDTTINLSYHSNNADNSANIGITGSTPGKAVWTEYDAVYHLSADGADSAANSLDGTLVAIDGTNIVDFGVGKGMTFDGSTEHIDLAINDLARVYTVSMFMELTNIISQYALIDGSNGGWYVDVDKLSYNTTSDGTTALLAGVPYDIALQDNTGVGETFIDGLPADSITPDAVNMLVDSVATETTTPANWFGGKLKEIRFAKDLKTPGWIASNYDSTQDSLVRFEHADSFDLIIGTVVINPAVGSLYNIGQAVYLDILSYNPGAAILHNVGGTPTIELTDHQILEALNGSIHNTGQDALIHINYSFNTSVGTIHLTGGVPAANIGTNLQVPAELLHLTGGTVTVEATDDKYFNPNAGNIHIVGSPVTLNTPFILDPISGQIIIVGNVPVIDVKNIAKVIEYLNVNDLYNALAYVRILESLGNTDVISAEQAIVRKLTEILNVDEHISTFMHGGISITDSAAFSDVIGIVVSEMIMEAFLADDVVDEVHLAINKVIDLISSTDIVTANAEFKSLIINALTILDVIRYSEAFVVTETLVATDTVNAIVQAVTEIIEALITTTIATPTFQILFFASSNTDINDVVNSDAIFSNLIQENIFTYGSIIIDDENYTFVMNSKTRGISEYTNYNFNSMSGNLAATSSGIYALTGNDDAGTNIDALIKTGLIDFDSSQEKQVPYAYIGLSKSGDMVLKTIVDYRGDRKERWYQVVSRTVDATDNIRVKLGKGIKSRYWQFSLQNVNGSNFELDSLEMMPLALKRRI